MNERPLPDEGRITDELPEAIAPLLPEYKNTHRFGDGWPHPPGAVDRSRKERLPYEITRSGLLAVSTAFLISLWLFRYAAQDPGSMAVVIGEPGCSLLLAVFPGGSFLGSALGAVIGQAFRDERGGAALMGAFVGLFAGPPFVLILLLELMTVIDIWHFCASALTR